VGRTAATHLSFACHARRSRLYAAGIVDDEQAGGPRRRDSARSFWPATVIVQRVAFEILAACWQVEATGVGAATPFDED
jgi:hypothetical protein